MEKTDRKSKSFIVLLLAILLCVAIVLGIGGFTYAKYISGKTVETQSATVAKWGYVISVDTENLFGKQYADNKITTETGASKVDVQAASANENNVVAPGTSGSMSFSVTGSAEVRSKITIAATTGTTVQLKWTDSDGNEQTYEPIKWTLTDSDSIKTTFDSYEKMIEGLNALSDSFSNINPNKTVNLSYTLSWAWEFESNNDEYDTILGEIANGGTVDGYTATTSVTLDLKITVEQIQGTGDSTLAAGLYDADDNLLVPYATSGMDVTTNYTEGTYQDGPSSPYYILNNTYTNAVCIVLPDDDITQIGTYAFYNCSSLEKVIIPDSVTSIGNYAFMGCSSLKSITIPDSVTSIGRYAFTGCSSLTSITIPDGVTIINHNTFENCEALESVTIGSGVTAIWSYAFDDCIALKSITIPDKVITIQSFVFNGCKALTSVTIGSGVLIIGDNAFKDCKALTSATFKNTEGWKAGDTSITSTELADPATAATYLYDTYCNYDWERDTTVSG